MGTVGSYVSYVQISQVAAKSLNDLLRFESFIEDSSRLEKPKGHTLPPTPHYPSNSHVRLYEISSRRVVVKLMITYIMHSCNDIHTFLMASPVLEPNTRPDKLDQRGTHLSHPLHHLLVHKTVLRRTRLQGVLSRSGVRV